MRVLVTGATGFVGSALVRRLCQEPDCTVLAMSRSGQNVTGKPAIAVRVPDLGPDTRLEDMLAGCDVVMHLAARVHIMRDRASDPLAEFRRANVDASVNLARQAIGAGVRRFIYVSSVKVHGETSAAGAAFHADDPPAPQDAYGQSKAEAEAALRELVASQQPSAHSGPMDLVIVRPPLVYGPGVRANFQALVTAVRRGWLLPLGAIDNRRTLVALGNLVDLLVVCARHPLAANQAFLVGDGADLSTAELVRRIALAMGRPARLLPVPPSWLEGAASLLGKGAAAQRLCGNLQLDISKTRSLLQWNPPLDIDTALRDTVAAL